MNRADRRRLERQQRRPGKPVQCHVDGAVPVKLMKLTALAVSSDQPMSPAAVERAMASAYVAMESFVRGTKPVEQDWVTLADVASWVWTLALRGTAPTEEVKPIVDAALLALDDVTQRAKAKKGMRLDGRGLDAVRAVVAVKRQALEELSEREAALIEVETAERLTRKGVNVSQMARICVSVGRAIEAGKP